MSNVENPVSDTAKCVRIDNQRGNEYLFHCPGCGCLHSMTVNGFVNSCGASWTFNGNVEKPTFSPSLLVTYDDCDDKGNKIKHNVCHSFINNGLMQFLGDCTHENRNKTLEIPAFKSMK